MKKKNIDNQPVELIHIEERNGEQVVSARELHRFLESKQEFANWIKNRIEKYDLIENVDYQVFDNVIKNPKGGRPLAEYALSVDAAKELSMVEGNGKGKQARRYFIEVEKRAKALFFEKHHSPASDRELHLAHALQLATDFINDNLPRMWYPSGTNSIAPMILTDLVERVWEHVYVEDLEVAEYLCSQELLSKSSDGFYYPTQEALDSLLLDIRQVTIQHVDGKRLSFGLPVFTERGIRRLEEVIVPLKQRQEILMNTQLFRIK